MRTLRERLGTEYNIIETERLILRPIRINDADDMFAYTGDPKVTEWIQIEHTDIKDVKTGIEEYFLADPIGKYGIELKENNKLIGGIDFRLNEDLSTAELGFVLNMEYQGRGYMQEAVQKMLWLAFIKLELTSVSSACVVPNISSAKVLEKAGMKKEGIQRMRYKMKGTLWDIIIYSILRSEYIVR